MKKLKAPKKLDIVLIIVAVFFMWFNSELLEIYREVGSIPEAYACAVVGVILGEAGICGWIKTRNEKAREREWSKEDRKEKVKVNVEDLPPEAKQIYDEILTNMDNAEEW